MYRIRAMIVEAHRRSLWQVLAIYVFGSWAMYEIIAEATERMALPDWVPGFAIVLFLIGLPIVVATAFVQEGLPGQTNPSTPPDAQSAGLGPADPTLFPNFEHAEVPERRATGQALLMPARPHVFLTWQKSVLAGITAFLLLGLTAGGYVGLRNAGIGPFASLITSGAMTARDRIIIAELDHTAHDTVMAAAVTEALRVDLAQSPVLTVLETRFIGDALERMGRSRDEHLNAALSREVAIREGAKAVLVGEISPAGSRYSITARLLHAGTGEMLTSTRATAQDADGIIAAIDQMSKKLREAVGESLRTVRADPPLEAVTTSSLTALQKYTLGVRAFDVEREYERSIQLFEEALATDSTFAMAWRKLAAAYNNTQAGRDRTVHAATRAYALRDRLTERERYHTLAFYHVLVTGDDAAAINAYRLLLDLYPDDVTALNNIAAAYSRARDLDRAADHYRRSIEVDSFSAVRWTNLTIVEYARGNADEARRLLEEVERRFPGQRDNVQFQVGMEHADGRHDEAERIARQSLADSRGSNLWVARSNGLVGELLQLRGRLREAQQHLARAAIADRARGVSSASMDNEVRMALMDSWFRGQRDRALGRLNRLIESDEWREAGPDGRPHLFVAYELASMGEPAMARRLVAEWDSRSESPGLDRMRDRDAALGWIALAENRPEEAFAILRTVESSTVCHACGTATLASAFDAAGMRDSAAVYYQRYIDTPQLTGFFTDAWYLALAYERLAEFHDSNGNVAEARRYAGLLIDLWKDADAELQPRVRRMERLIERRVEH